MNTAGVCLSHLIVAVNRTLEKLVLKEKKNIPKLCMGDAEEKLHIPKALLFINSTSV